MVAGQHHCSTLWLYLSQEYHILTSRGFFNSLCLWAKEHFSGVWWLTHNWNSSLTPASPSPKYYDCCSEEECFILGWRRRRRRRGRTRRRVLWRTTGWGPARYRWSWRRLRYFDVEGHFCTHLTALWIFTVCHRKWDLDLSYKSTGVNDIFIYHLSQIQRSDFLEARPEIHQCLCECCYEIKLDLVLSGVESSGWWRWSVICE